MQNAPSVSYYGKNIERTQHMSDARSVFMIIFFSLRSNISHLENIRKYKNSVFCLSHFHRIACIRYGLLANGAMVIVRNVKCVSVKPSFVLMLNESRLYIPKALYSLPQALLSVLTSRGTHLFCVFVYLWFL